MVPLCVRALPLFLACRLGANALTEGVAIGNALCGEIVMTFVLVSLLCPRAQGWADV